METVFANDYKELKDIEWDYDEVQAHNELKPEGEYEGFLWALEQLSSKALGEITDALAIEVDPENCVISAVLRRGRVGGDGLSVNASQALQGAALLAWGTYFSIRTKFNAKFTEQ